MEQLSLPESSLIYVDTVVLIYSIEKFLSYFSLLEPLWRQLQAGTVQVMTIPCQGIDFTSLND